MDFGNLKPSKNIEDHTGIDKSQYDWVYLLGREALENQKIDPNEALRGLTPEQVNGILFQKALEEFGGLYMNKFAPPKMPQGKGPLRK